MKKFDYFNFLGHETVTIREIISCYTKDVTYFEVSLEETDEVIKLSVPSENAFRIQPRTVISHSSSDNSVCGHSLWKKGHGPFKIVMP